MPEASPLWTAFTPEVWWAPYVVSGVGHYNRTTLVRLESGGLLVMNPGRGLAEAGGLGLPVLAEVEYLLAPNHFHHLGIAAWQRVFDHAPVICSGQAQARLARKGIAPMRAPHVIETVLPKGVEILEPPGTRSGELWLRLERDEGVAWFVGDAFFNVPVTPRNLAGIFLHLSGTTPGLRIGRTFTWMQLRDVAQYRDWLLDRLAVDSPVCLVPAHGDILEDPELPSRLSRLVEARLG